MAPAGRSGFAGAGGGFAAVKTVLRTVWPAALPPRGFRKPKSSPARSRAGELSRLFRRLILHAQRPDPVRPIVGVALVGAFI